ncbi:histidine acid phosphatase-like protein [Mollisia scopiformis]|uniref:Histidine acid phosphatase-like protein n=1 Tax=Mollisia scopiformis TaxID=149040 RepID=A0A194XS15_MOLSC|nr:histidine acid phosphatase-like protein [Mollisia scopiformis]KUJ22936.1 histidine acid phosphatase-like protein [Mollisia scopiformis]
MAPVALSTVLATLFAIAVAQTEQITWSAITFTYHGEKVPDLYPSPYYLTPYGANQLLNAGQIVRDRHISPPENGSLITGAAVINGISTAAIDNTQLYILGTDDTVISQSMQAFMQGLYPPREAPSFDQYDVMADGTLQQYPLDGYQYPVMSAVSELDFNYIYVAGNTGCTTNDILTVETLDSDPFIQEVENTESFYTALNSSIFSGLPIDILNYGNAWDLYEYALFEYTHNGTIANSSEFTTTDLELLYSLASAQQWTFNTPSEDATIQAMAGRTYASKVLEQFSHNIASSGSTDKLSLLFGSFEPFLGFFALSNLATGPSAGRFNSLPLHGSTMTFELFSFATPSDGNLSTPFPDVGDLRVRFLYRNGTGDSDTLIEYALFGRGNSEADMSWTDFVQGMGEFSLNDLVDWCTECNTASLFCEALEDSQSTNSSSSSTANSSGSSRISPTIGGVIGAAVTVALMIIVAAALLLFGFRLEHRGNGAKGGDLGVLKRSGSGNGGFKGAERLASDTDLRLKSGAGATVVRHERVGSWELNESPTDRKHASLDKEIESGGITSTADYGRHSEDGLEHVNPVKPLDQV